MNPPLVSILIATYNAEAFIKKTLDSCLMQAYESTEILVFDDGSTDGTIEILESYGESKVIVFSDTKKMGPYGALNFLLEKAKGEYIAIQDHDDVWMPEKLSLQIALLESELIIDACGTESYYFYENEGILLRNRKADPTTFVDHTSLVFRNLPSYRYNTNWIFADEHFEKVVLGANTRGIRCIQDPLLIHRIRGNGKNLSSSRFHVRPKDISQFFQLHPLSASSLSYFFDLVFGRYIPQGWRWSQRKRRVKDKTDWLTLSDYTKDHPNTPV